MNRMPILYSFIGTIIGASFFTLPYVFSNQNIIISVSIFAIIFLLVSYTNYIYAEIIVKTHSAHHLPGYVGLYLGSKMKLFTSVMGFLGGLGSNLAYIIISISFIRIAIPDINDNFLAVLIIIFIGFTTSNGTIFQKSEKILTTLLSGLLLFLSFYLIFSSNLNHTFNEIMHNKVNYMFIFPILGITLSANAGFGILPELKHEMKHANRFLTIFSNASIPLILYALFIVGVLGSHQGISKDSLTGLTTILPQGLVYITITVGLLAILTSFESNVIVSIDTLRRDFNFSKAKATLVVFLIPTILFITGLKDLVLVLSIVGGVFAAFTHLVIHLVSKKAYKFSLWSKISIAVFSIMICGEIVTNILKIF